MTIDLRTDTEKDLEDALHAYRKRAERLRKAVERIDRWSKAYPIDVFPEPDWKRVNEVLAASRLSLAAVSASNMRHVVEGVGKIAREALRDD